MVIGITGGVGCGKSTICKYIEENTNSIIVYTDLIAKDLLEIGSDCYCDVISFFGDDILNEDLSINRKNLAKIVFNDKEKLEVLNSFTHKKTIEIVKGIIEANKGKVIIIESALLLETELTDLCDYKIFVTTNYDNRKQRLISGRGYSVERINDMISKQKDDEYYSSKTDFTLVNDNLEDAQENIKKKLIELGIYEGNVEINYGMERWKM